MATPARAADAMKKRVATPAKNHDRHGRTSRRDAKGRHNDRDLREEQTRGFLCPKYPELDSKDAGGRGSSLQAGPAVSLSEPWDGRAFPH